MGLSILVAKILALIYISVGLGVLSGKLSLKKIIEDFENSAGLTYLTGVVTIVFGVILIEYHNIWVRDWRVLITVIGWMALLKGMLLIAAPRFLTAFKNWYTNTTIWGIVVILIGLLFGFFGFVV